MSKIAQAFKDKKAFIPFITCGDPNLETTKEIIYSLEKAGASIIELGIPFSDPTAEGETIQDANIRALKNNVTTDNIFDMIATLDVKIPLVFMTYANIVYSYGIERFAKKCKEIGMSGIILPEIPFEEKEEFSVIFEENGLDFISLIAPTSNDRIKMIAENASGFIYLVSSLGVTGVRQTIATDIDSMVELVRTVTDLPVAVGFGVSTKEQAKQMTKKADGVIVGSAIVKIIAEHAEKSPTKVFEYVSDIVESI